MKGYFTIETGTERSTFIIYISSLDNLDPSLPDIQIHGLWEQGPETDKIFLTAVELCRTVFDSNSKLIEPALQLMRLDPSRLKDLVAFLDTDFLQGNRRNFSKKP